MAPSTPGDRRLDELKVQLERERSARREVEARADRATRASLEKQRALTLLHDIATTANQPVCLDEHPKTPPAEGGRPGRVSA
jgi:hypothetical protein